MKVQPWCGQVISDDCLRLKRCDFASFFYTRRYEPKANIGKVLIITNQVYHKHHSAGENTKDCNDCTRRNIATEDENLNKLVKLFTDLGFKDISGKTDGFIHRNKTKREMIELLEEVAKQDLSQDYCFLCVILAYGKDNVITCLDEKGNTDIRNPSPNMLLPLTELQNCLKGENCKSLLAKPKLFMLQLDKVPTDTSDSLGPFHPFRRFIKIPREADFLTYTCEKNAVIDAWIEGFKTYVLEPQKNGKEPMEIQRLLTRMTNIHKSKYKEEENITVDYPCVTSLLTKQVFLKKKE